MTGKGNKTGLEKKIVVKEGRAYLHRTSEIGGIIYESVIPLGSDVRLIGRFIDKDTRVDFI